MIWVTDTVCCPSKMTQRLSHRRHSDMQRDVASPLGPPHYEECLPSQVSGQTILMASMSRAAELRVRPGDGGLMTTQCSLSGAVRGGTMAPAPYVLIKNRWKEGMGARSLAWAHRSAPHQPCRVSGPQLSSIPLNLRQSQSPRTSKIHCCLREQWSCAQIVKEW